MRTDDVTRFHQILSEGPEAPGFQDFARHLRADADLQDQWLDFLTSQSVEGVLDASWESYLKGSPGSAERMQFHQEVQQKISELHLHALKAQATSYLPQVPLTLSRQPVFRSLLRIMAIAAGSIGVILVWSLLTSDERGSTSDLPVLMVERFEIQGTMDSVIMNGIPQRLPAKLAAVKGLYPVTSYALDQSLKRTGDVSLSAQEIGANYTVRGKITRTGNKFNVHAEMINLQQQKPIWSSSFTVDPDVKAFDDVQDAIADKVVTAFDLPVSPAIRRRLDQDVSASSAAVALFMKGERKWAERTEQSLDDAIALLEQAHQEDPASTLISGYLALCYATVVENGWELGVGWQDATEMAHKTLHADPGNPEALLVLGAYEWYDRRNYSRGEEYLSEALALQPSDAKIHQAFAELYIRTGQFAEGQEHLRIARRIEPEHRVIRWIETKYLTAAGQLEQARHAADALLAVYPDYPNIQNFYWIYYLTLGDHARAIASIPAGREQGAQDYMRAIAYTDMRDLQAAHALFPQLNAPADSLDGLIASLKFTELVQLGQWDQAYTLLERQLATEGFGLLPLLQTSDFMMFRPVRTDPVIRDIMRRHGIIVHVIPEAGPEM